MLSIGPDQQDTVVVSADTCPICLIREIEARLATTDPRSERSNRQNGRDQQ
jgi:hypothetical protein